MSYTPNVWQAGDVVTPAKLNHIEEGIASSGGGLVIHQTVNSGTGAKTMDKTWQEIYDAVEAGSFAMLIDLSDGYLTTYPVAAVGISEGEPQVAVVDYYYSSILRYTALSVSSYPVYGNSTPK